MTALSLAIVLQMAAQPACTVPGMVPQFWPQVVTTESRYDPLAIGDDTAKQSFYPPTVALAEDLAVRLMQAGHSVGIGLSQLTAKSPEQFERKFGITIHDAFDACRNMHIGAKFYVDRALRIYNCGRINCGIAYAQRVVAAAQAVKDGGGQVQVTETPPTQTTPECDAPVWDMWARHDCVTASKKEQP